MATVLSSKGKIFRRHTFENEEPSTSIDTEVTTFLKDLSSKQLDTNLTIEKHLLDERDFVHGTEINGPMMGNAWNRETPSQNETKSNVDTDSYDITQSISDNAFKGIDVHKFDNKPSPYELPRTILRHRRQLLDSDREPLGPFQELQFKRKKNTLVDVKCLSLRKPQGKMKTVEFKSSRQFTISQNRIIPLQKSIHAASKSNVLPLYQPGCSFVAATDQSRESPKYNARITEEQIRELPKFRNYETGVPSKVLYLKNISSGVNEDDLITIFNKYESSDQTKIVYRLTKKGRMRGQGFVRFPCVETAVNALKETNGIIVKDKPIIMLYSNSEITDK